MRYTVIAGIPEKKNGNRNEMKQIIALGHVKGGVGKTTIAVNLATMIKEMRPGWKVILADADPLKQAAYWLGYSKEADVPVVPVNMALLRAALESIDADLIVLDLPSVLESVLLEAIEVATLMLMPVCPSLLDVEQTTVYFKKNVRMYQQHGTKMLMVPNKIDRRDSTSGELLEGMQQARKVSRATIGLRTAYSAAISYGLGVNKTARRSEAFREVKALASEVLGIINDLRQEER